MSNLVAFGGGTGLISRESLANNLQRSAQALPTTGNGGAQYLKMDKGNGDWIFGAEETVVEDGSLWAINPGSLMHGWVAWDSNAGGAPVQEIMVSINRDLPPENSLPVLGLGSPDKKTGVQPQLRYQQQRSVQAVCISGEDEGTVVEYKQSSVGAMKLFAELTNKLLDQLDKDPDKLVAIVNFSSESYKHKTYGRITNPVWPIVEWRTLDNTAPVAGADEGDEPEAEGDKPEDDGEEARLAAEYAAEQEKAKTDDAAPRRRLRR